jgi:hypothetical protein
MEKYMRLFCGLLFVALNSFAASPIIFGARGGAALNDNAESLTSSALSRSPAKTYVVGPTLGVRLPMGFSVEGDALYNRQNLNFGQIGGFSAAAHSDSWEFPVMLKYTIGHGTIAPVLGGGISFRHINDFGSLPSYLFNGSTNSNSYGYVVGGGFQFRAGPVSITPEVRYTRWQSSSLVQQVIDAFVPGRNAAQVLIGVTF